MHHIMGKDRRIGQHDPLDRTVRDITFVPEGDVLHAGLQIAAKHA